MRFSAPFGAGRRVCTRRSVAWLEVRVLGIDEVGAEVEPDVWVEGEISNGIGLQITGAGVVPRAEAYRRGGL